MSISVVGIGLDGAAGLTANAKNVVEQATVLAGGKRHLGYFVDHSAQKIPLIDFPQDLRNDRVFGFSSTADCGLSYWRSAIFWLG